MPVQADDLDRAVVLGAVRPLQRPHEDAEQVDDSRENVAAVEPGQDVEGGAEQSVDAPGVRLDRHPLHDQMRPLVRLDPEERGAAEHRRAEVAEQPLPIAVLDGGQRLHHRDAAADQDEGVEGGERHPQVRGRNRPVRAPQPDRPVGGQEPRERHGVGAEEHPHHQLSPTRGELVLVTFDAVQGRSVRHPGAPSRGRFPRGRETLAQDPGRDSSQRSFPEYDRLKLLLQSGKSGTMFFRRAKVSGRQLTNDGSLTLTRSSRDPSGARTQCRIDPRQPSTRPKALSQAGSGPRGTRTAPPAGIASTAWRISATDSRASSTRISARAWTSPESLSATLNFSRSYAANGWSRRASRSIPEARAT